MDMNMNQKSVRYIYWIQLERTTFCILAIVINLSRVTMAPSSFGEEGFDCSTALTQTRSVPSFYLAHMFAVSNELSIKDFRIIMSEILD